MLNSKLSNDKVFSFGKNNISNQDQKTNNFKKDKIHESKQRGRNPNKKNENKYSGGVLLTFGMDKENRNQFFFTSNFSYFSF